MDSRRSDRSRPSRPMSPAFRSGPRHKPSDANADEIIRFVREFQCSDLQSQNPGAQGLRKRAVLPAIGQLNNNTKIDESIHPTNKSDDDISSDIVGDTLAPSQILNTSVNISTADSGFVDKTSEPPDSNSDDNEDSIYNSNNNNNNEYYDSTMYDGEDLELTSLETRVDPFRYKSGVVDIRKETFSEINDMRPVDRHSLVAEDQLISSRCRRPSKIVDKLLHGSNSSNSSSIAILSYNNTPRRHSHIPSKGGQLLRPRALPQLPPITKVNDIPARPSAPSPSLTPPSPHSAAGTDDEDVFDNDYIDDGDRIEPVDYIDSS